MENAVVTDAGKTKSARNASLLIFLVCGIGLSSWAPMVPFAKINLGLDDAALGLVLLSLGAGAILTMPFTGFFINKFGSRRVMLISAIVIAIILPLLLLTSSAVELAIALFVFGASIGSIDVAMNSHAVLVQDRYGRHIMSSFHGMFSLGGLAGSIGLGFLIKMGLSPTVAAVSISALLVLIAVSQYQNLFPKAEEKSVDSFSFSLPRGPVLALGLMCFVFFLAEGALLDWSAVFLQFNRNFDPSMAGLGYAVFSVAMAIMRLTGDKIVHKIGSSKVVLIGALVSAAGYMLAVMVPWQGAALIGFALVGLGAANVVPVFFTAAGNIPNIPASVSLPAVTTLGYMGQLAGPAMIGFIAEASSLPIALGFVGVLLLIVAFTYKEGN
ncbi:Major Facilitator Superfamily protein [Dyadobacter koreensis]|uniref:Major Facilitator Superfamily protein n=1 Tax=Dyadobacter koreensis TaxID=408657 RepID=A0A1H6XWC7_9BACT|nr:MFS transporter [Dyadobacter koreensis]SEJ29192.1 Major Facilitator Superfamily protein [Dyadobacter koreensis]